MKNGHLKTAQRAVTELRTLLLQDYLRMELDGRYTDDSWKQILFDFYKAGLDGDHPEQYAVPYHILQSRGTENYGVTDMDTTVLISVIGFSVLTEELGIGGGTIENLKILQQDRNSASHSSEHETAEHLYEAGMTCLDHLKDFIEISCAESAAGRDTLDDYRRKHLLRVQGLQDEYRTALRRDGLTRDGLSLNRDNLTRDGLPRTDLTAARTDPHSSWAHMPLRKPCDCPACRDVNAMVLNRKRSMYRCMTCGFTMSRKERMKDILWFCDGCDTFLNMQPGFDTRGHGKTWICTVCGYSNDVSEKNIF